MIKPLSIVALVSLVSLTGCATGSNEAYGRAHEATAKARTEEAKAKAATMNSLALATASAAKNCTTEVCVVASMMSLASMHALAAVGSGAQSAATAIAAPVDTALEWGKLLVPAATQIAGGYFSTVLGIVNSTKGPANTDVASQGLTAITPVAPWAPTPAQ